MRQPPLVLILLVVALALVAVFGQKPCRYIFVSTTKTTGSFMLQEMDDECVRLANSSTVTRIKAPVLAGNTTYKAWLSSSSRNARDVLKISATDCLQAANGALFLNFTEPGKARVDLTNEDDMKAGGSVYTGAPNIYNSQSLKRVFNVVCL